jgi:hypothetical protein
VADYRTVLVAGDAHADPVLIIKRCAPSGALVKIRWKRGDWSQIVLRIDPKSILTFTKCVRLKPGDEFSRMVLGFHNYIRHVKTRSHRAKKPFLAHVADCSLAIGVLCEPSFDLEEWQKTILAVAREMGALIWNGSGMLDAEGRLLLAGPPRL